MYTYEIFIFELWLKKIFLCMEETLVFSLFKNFYYYKICDYIFSKRNKFSHERKVKIFRINLSIHWIVDRARNERNDFSLSSKFRDNEPRFLLIPTETTSGNCLPVCCSFGSRNEVTYGNGLPVSLLPCTFCHRNCWNIALSPFCRPCITLDFSFSPRLAPSPRPFLLLHRSLHFIQR